MLRQIYLIRVFALLVALAGFSCLAQAQSTKDILSNPQVDDVYVAQLDQFSQVTFGKQGDKAYGLLRVIEVNDTQIVVITTQKGWSDSRAVFVVLKQDAKTIEWDEAEKIVLLRANLLSLEETDLILEAFRMKGQLGGQ